MWLWFKSAADYKATFGVRRDLDYYTEVVKQVGGESRTIACAGGTKRGWSFNRHSAT